MLSRRRYLSGVVTTVAVGVAGCLGGGTADVSVDSDREPTRGEADPVTVTREYDDDPDVEYNPETERVRTDDGPEDVREWLADRAPRVARDDLDSLLTERLDDDEGVGATLRLSGILNLLVTRTAILTRDGDVGQDPGASFEDVVAATPATVTAVARLDGFERKWSDEVQVEDELLREQ